MSTSPLGLLMAVWCVCVGSVFASDAPGGDDSNTEVKEPMVRVVSYNIRHGEGMDRRIDLDRIAEVISRADPDLVALQEVDRHCTRSGNLDLAVELGRRLDMHPAFGKFMDFQGGEYGMAVLSRDPTRKVIRHVLPEGAEPRCALEIEVDLAGWSHPVSFISIHNDWIREDVRVKQIQALLDALDGRRHPVILAGDFNGERSDASLELLKDAGWSILEKGGANTWPSDDPRVEIDFIVLRGFPDLSVVHDVMNESMASDHRPIRATIRQRSVPHGDDLRRVEKP